MLCNIGCPGSKTAIKKKLFWITGIIIITLIGVAVIGLNYTGSNTSQFTGPVSADNPLPEALISDLEEYIKQLMRQMDVPGLSMVLVEGDQVNYERAFGVRDLETKAPVTTQTLFGIASDHEVSDASEYKVKVTIEHRRC